MAQVSARMAAALARQGSKASQLSKQVNDLTDWIVWLPSHAHIVLKLQAGHVESQYSN